MEGGVAERELVELRALHEEVQVVLPREADAAVHLQRRAHHALRRVGAPRLRGRRRDVRLGVAGADAPRRPVDRRAHALDVDQHVGAAVLHRLERPDRPAELHAVLGVLDRDVERARRAAEQVGRGEGRAPVEQPARGRRRRRACARGPGSKSSQPSSRVRSIAGWRRGRSAISIAYTASPAITTATSADGAYGTGADGSHATHASASPATRRSTHSSRPPRAKASIASTVGTNGAGAAWRPSSSHEHRDLDRAEADAARGPRRTSIPSQPCSAIAAQSAASYGGVGAGVRPHLSRRGEPVEEFAGAVAERDLIVGEVEVHGRASLASRRRRNPRARSGRERRPLRAHAAGAGSAPVDSRRDPTPKEQPHVRTARNTHLGRQGDRAPHRARHRGRVRDRHLEAAGPDRPDHPRLRLRQHRRHRVGDHLHRRRRSASCATAATTSTTSPSRSTRRSSRPRTSSSTASCPRRPSATSSAARSASTRCCTKT